MNQTSAKKFAITQKKIAKGYMLSNVLKAEADFDETIRRFENCIDSLAEAGEPIQLDAWFTYFAFDLVGQATFSKPFGFLEQGQDVKNCIATSHALIPYLTVMAHFPQYHDFLMLNPLTKWLNFQPMKHVMDTTTRAVIEREQSLVSGSDMMEHWKSQKAGDPLTRRELLATANANVAAGADTVGTQMQSFVYLMLRHPECLRRLRTELDEALLKNKISSPVSYNASQGLQYFQACVSGPPPS
ncbi:MAG: hypothetical protein LQ340_001558 [Diploschistes diacapsis]|nr:MAG: hypothetical protein LQ340_001558 [Diploschistes diacapsis]